MQPLRFPDFFVIGAPRCGTTAMCRYLSRNPQICFSRPKEPHYLARLDHEPTSAELERDYLAPYFSHLESGHSAVGEGSVSYLYLPGVIERIERLNPKARYVVMVRNPLDMLRSYHLRMLFLLQEDEADFDRAWALEASRKNGENIPGTCLDPRMLFYSEAAKFGVQVERLFELVGRDRSHVIVFDDFKADLLNTYKTLLDFLEVEYDGQTEFERRYASHIYRYRWLQKLLFVPAIRSGQIVKKMQSRTRKYNPDGSKQPGLLKRIGNLNRVPQAPAPLSPELSDTIRDTLRPDVRRLSELLGRDLEFWLDPTT